MEATSTSRHVELALSNPDELTLLESRIRQEHRLLRHQIRMVEMYAKEAMLIEDPAASKQLVLQLEDQLEQFVMDLERHAAWEQTELYPLLLAYYHHDSSPTIRPSFWVLEKEYQLGISFIQSFHEAISQMAGCACDCTGRSCASEAAAHLVQACLIFNDHFTMEEELVLPMTDKVLTDLDYFFS
ncbi:hemerythrin domain-containing protein [Paenibacillus kobensis]|uniref:hemerythrin domain-containing protein n=1 Tax=Paenibacillus kobensis TaxID=59841 RepID=UPI0013E2E857|nr:hemerythrin domain-containing protein [Paenibacillus kobensis]